MKTIFDLCKRLDNPVRRELLRRVYTSRGDGANVTLTQDESGVGLSGASQYLKQLEELGLIARRRSGRFVNYLADWSLAPKGIKTIAAMLHARIKEDGTIDSLAPVFHAVMNPFRGRVLNWLMRGGKGDKKFLADRFGKDLRTIDRDLKPAIDAGLLDMTDDDEDVGSYVFVTPEDSIARAIIALAV